MSMCLQVKINPLFQIVVNIMMKHWKSYIFLLLLLLSNKNDLILKTILNINQLFVFLTILRLQFIFKYILL